MKNIYISGTSSGLGNYLLKNIKKSKKFYRNKKNKIKDNSILIHNAFFKKKNNESKSEFNTNNKITINLYNKIKTYNFKIIVLISTIDLYQNNHPKNSYIFLKKKLEKEIKKQKKFYIFRCGLLIGKSMSRNSFFKLIKAKTKTHISLSKKSSMYLTSYKDVLKGIKAIIKKSNIKCGIYNVVSAEKFYFDNVKNENIIFGNYKLSYKKISNLKFEKNFKLKTETNSQLIRKTLQI